MFTAFCIFFAWISYSHAGSQSFSHSDIEDQLRALPEARFVQEQFDPAPDPGMRIFKIQVEQPIDHDHPENGTFLQTVILHHRSEYDPVILQTSGYQIFAYRMSALARKFHANQIQVEHRYFGQSVPTQVSWPHLSVRQSAFDFHRITEAFKKIYPKPWVNTGASKGGMTSIFHRYFFPNDVSGTVADVAPLSFSTSDSRYIEFIKSVGGESRANCRKKIQDYQTEMLSRRGEFHARPEDQFRQLGSSDTAYEHALVELPFYFWQYGNPDNEKSGCDSIPRLASYDDMLEFLNHVSGVSEYSDQSLTPLLPYFFQAAHELGTPANWIDHLGTLLRYDFSLSQYIPRNSNPHYSNELMIQIQTWMKQEADHILLIYGEYDPWTAGAFPTSQSGREVIRLDVPEGNHSAKFYLLPHDSQEKALKMLSVWLNRKPIPQALSNEIADYPISLDTIEFKERRRHLH